MRDFNRNNSPRGNNRGNGRREDRQMHRATCADCGRDCEVPFRPSGDKPVYCSNCFKRDDDSRGNSRGNSRGGDRGRPTMHKATCADCGKSCEVPFRPSGDKPVYCSDCFGRGDSPAPKKPEQSNEKHDEINAKLDKILFLLQRADPIKEITVMKPKKATTKTKSPVKKAPAKKKAATKTKSPVKKAPAKKKAK